MEDFPKVPPGWGDDPLSKFIQARQIILTPLSII